MHIEDGRLISKTQKRELAAKGDLQGHEFYGNQYTAGGKDMTEHNALAGKLHAGGMPMADAISAADKVHGVGSPDSGAGTFTSRALPGVTPLQLEGKLGNQLPARDVTFNERGGGTAPKNVNEVRGYSFESASGGFGRGSNALFQIHGTFAEAKQKAAQQAGAYGHNQLRVAR